MHELQMARDKADEIIEKYRADRPSVNVFDIAEAEGLRITYFQPQGGTAELISLLDEDGGRIFVDAGLPADHQAYVIAYQLGHHLLGHDVQYSVLEKGELWDGLSDAGLTQEKRLANTFAVEFLMPDRMVRRAQQDYGLTNRDTTMFKRLFGVPLPVAVARLGA